MKCYSIILHNLYDANDIQFLNDLFVCGLRLCNYPLVRTIYFQLFKICLNFKSENVINIIVL